MVITHVNKENYDSEVLNSDIPVIVDFWASWCGPCQMMGPVFEKLSGEYDGKLKFTKLNTDEEPEIAKKYDIMGIPALVVMQKGKEIDRIVGFAPEQVLKQKIDAILEKAG